MAVGKDGSPETDASLFCVIFSENAFGDLSYDLALYIFLSLQLCVLFCSLTAQCVQSNEVQSKQSIF